MDLRWFCLLEMKSSGSENVSSHRLGGRHERKIMSNEGLGWVPFRRVSSQKRGPTQHLYLINAPEFGGDSENWREHGVYDECMKHGTVTGIFSVPSKNFCFVSFSSTSEAALAHAFFSSNPLPCGRRVYPQYSEPAPPPKAPQGDQMRDVDSSKHVQVPGMRLIQGFLSKEEELEVLRVVDSLPWQEGLSRRVQHYGYTFDYSIRGINFDKPQIPMPPALFAVAEKMHAQGIIPMLPDQLTVNEYPSGKGINMHVDTHSQFEGPIISVTLAAATVMELRPPNEPGDSQVPRESKFLHLTEGSLLVLDGESRFEWCHGIAQRKFDLIRGAVVERSRRVSLTFRKVNMEGRCRCSYPNQCDSQGAKIPDPHQSHLQESRADKGLRMGKILEMSQECSGQKLQGVPDIERDHVHKFYDAIAPHFDKTRYKPWPKVSEFMSSLPPYSLVADVGCGNGRYLKCCHPTATIIALDRSPPLVQLADAANPCQGCTFVGDAVQVSLRTGIFDAAISIAVLHHISTFERRQSVIAELARLVKPGGRVMVYAWSRDQEEESRFRFQSRDELVPWTVKGGNGAEDGEVLRRYCHLFEEGEMRRLCEGVQGIKVDSEYYDASNWCLVFTRC